MLMLFLLAEAPASPQLQVEKLEVRDETPAAKDLVTVHRIYVDVLNGGEAAAQSRDLLIASLQKTRLFIITENQDRADAVLKGGADDKVFTDKFHSTDNLNMHTQVSGASRSSSTRYYSEGESHSKGIGVGESESTNIEERKHEAFAAVRLVNREGDVIWSVTEESLGAKFLGARADVADKIARQITVDYRRLQLSPQDKQGAVPAIVR
jgi:hypothetical protein